MVPKVAGTGTSFQGACQYYLHDKDAQTAERVGFVETLNLRTDDPDKAWRIMAMTASRQDALKLDAGVPLTGKKTDQLVYAYSLSWSPDEKPTRKEMMKTVRSSLKALGAHNRQAIVVQHLDEPHPHVHVIVNRVDPDTGKVFDLYRDQDRLSDWALAYEKSRGAVLCKQREENARRREKGEFVKYRDPVIARAWKASGNGRGFAAELAKGGYTLARGDRRGFVVVDSRGKVINPTRQIEGKDGRNIRAAELAGAMKDLDPARLPSVEQARAAQGKAREEERTRREKAVRAAERRREAMEAAHANARNDMDRRHLDERRRLEARGDRKRQEAKDTITRTYRREQEAKRLAGLEAALQQKAGLWSRITGQRAKMEDEAAAVRMNLADIDRRAGELLGRVETEIANDNAWQAELHRREQETLAMRQAAWAAAPDRDAEIARRVEASREAARRAGREMDGGRSLEIER